MSDCTLFVSGLREGSRLKRRTQVGGEAGAYSERSSAVKRYLSSRVTDSPRKPISDEVSYSPCDLALQSPGEHLSSYRRTGTGSGVIFIIYIILYYNYIIYNP